jgi:hypothetical protein
MNIYRNKNWTERSYECTNIVACQAEEPPADHWQLVSHEIGLTLLHDMTLLQIIGDVSYYGYL